jgi:N-acetylglucosaminyldiphosphoundecaprenol N-acetyl-beta-D-mannosaminyltransferase
LVGAVAGFLLQGNTDVLTLHARGAAITLCWGLMLAALALEDAPPQGESFGLMGRRFFQGSLADAGGRLLEAVRVRPRQGLSVHVVNVHTLVEGRRDPALGRFQDEADLLLPDGRPLSLAAKVLGSIAAQQVRGPDILRWLAAQGRTQAAKHYFYGGVPGAPEAVAASLGAKAPGMIVAGAQSPPFREPSDAELETLIAILREKDVDFLWLGLGAPRQEKVMGRLKALGCPCVMLGVGAAFDYEAGAKREAPAWMQTAGLEWVFRLASEPERLWKRYFSTNPIFVGALALEFFGVGPWRQAPAQRALRVGACVAVLGALAVGSSALCLALLLLAGLLLGEASARRAGEAA